MQFIFTGNPKTWMASAFENPYPVHYNLRSILDLFKPEYFKNTPHIKYKKIKKGLQTFLQVCMSSQMQQITMINQLSINHSDCKSY